MRRGGRIARDAVEVLVVTLGGRHNVWRRAGRVGRHHRAEASTGRSASANADDDGCAARVATGDQGEINAAGNWKISGRIKNLIVLNSGHNIAPEPIEDELLNLLPNAQHVVVVGNGRSYLSAIVTGSVNAEQVQAALDAVNPSLPHYKQVRAFRISAEAFTPDNGLLTANGKLKRDAIGQRFKQEIEEMYAVRQAV